MRRRLDRLEAHTSPADEKRPNDTTEFFELEMEFYLSGESAFDYNEQERAFYSQDGRLVLSETYVDFPAWLDG